MATGPCKACGFPRYCFQWQVFANGTTHIRVTCESCKAFAWYAPQTPENLRAVGPRPVTPVAPPITSGGLFDGT